MEKIAQSVTQLIGNTPLLELSRLARKVCPNVRLLAKIERNNPAGSSKDRVALAILEDAEEKGLLCPSTVLIEPTSGNTGVALAMLASVKGYRAIVVMPENASEERKTLVKAYGAELVLSPASEGMKGAIERAETLKNSLPSALILGQFTNACNPLAHYQTTGVEIWRDTAGKVDAFVCGIGTGGTLSGVGKYLKEQNADVKVFGVEPASSPVLTAGKGGAHGIQGIGAGFVPETLDKSLLDGVLTVTDEEAYEYARLLAKKEGVLAGISSGAAVAGAVKVAANEEFRGKTVVVLLPDTGERYLSTDLYK